MIEDNLLNKQLDEYRLEALLGRGGMARVYRALDVRLKRYAAVKVIDTPFRSNSEYMERFEREAQAIAQLDHPHIIRIYRYGEVDNLLYMAMQYVEGSDLQALLQSYEKNGEFIVLHDVVRIIGEVCQALDYAHDKGVIHRDIKPSNIMLDADGRVIVADFGLALLTDIGTRGEIFGTPQYIAPEQAISSAGVVPQSDFYAVGVILYRMLTGKLPFDSNDLLELAMQHMTEPPPPLRQLRPDISPEVEAVVLKSLAKAPGERYSSGAALAEALDKAVGQSATGRITNSRPTMTLVELVALEMEPLPPLPAGLSPPLATPPVTESLLPTRALDHSPADAVMLPEQNAYQVTTNRDTVQVEKHTTFPFILKAGLAGLLLGLLFLVLLLWSESKQPTEETAAGGVVSTPTDTLLTQAATAVGGDDAVNTAAGTVPPDVTPTLAAATSPTSELTQVSLPIIFASTETAVIASTPIESTPVPTAPPATSTVENTPVPTAPPATSTVENTPVPTAPPATATVAPPISSDYTLVIDRRRDTLFITNQSPQTLSLADLALRMPGRRGETFTQWPLPTLDSGMCLHISKKANNASQDISETSCNQLVGTLILFDWKNEFTVLYNGVEAGNCHLRGNQGSCTVVISGRND